MCGGFLRIRGPQAARQWECICHSEQKGEGVWDFRGEESDFLQDEKCKHLLKQMWAGLY